ncbi:MAG TPA: MFS transporter [Gaiellaceae bacterium]|nr:MFS transporter [Gaiellaceae bacterium]
MRYRWVVLAAGTFAQSTYAASFLGPAVLAPALRARYGLSLTEIGVLLAASNLGSIPTLYAWGIATDRWGERTVIGAGLCAASACLAAAAFASSFAALTALLFLAGALGASVNSASGRAVMHWFKASQRGFALGIRQTAVPIGGAWVALAMPLFLSAGGVRAGILALAVGCFLGGAIGWVALREGPEAEREEVQPRVERVLQDRSLWRLAGASSLLLAPQSCLVGFLVLFLHEHRGLSTTSAGIVLAALNVLGIATRIGAGRWSDIARSRVRPLRRIALLSATLVLCCTALISGPIGLLVPALVLMGCVTISWNGLSFAAAAEAAGHARSGTSIGLQQTALAISGAVFPVAFGVLVAATSWRAGFAVVALFPLLGWRMLATVPG